MTGETVTDKPETVSKAETVVLTTAETRAETSTQVQNTTACPSSDSKPETVTSTKTAADTSQPDRYEDETDQPVFSSASTTAAVAPQTTASEKSQQKPLSRKLRNLKLLKQKHTQLCKLQ